MKQELHEIIQKIVEEILDEAIRRQDYVEGLVNNASGAMGEYFKARYAQANATKRAKAGKGTQQGWDREASSRLHFNFANAADKTFKGDPQLAFAEAEIELRKMVPRYLNWAKEHVAEAFRLNPNSMEDPTDASTDEFFATLKNKFDAVVFPK